jgi:hypothetical protein
MLVSDSLLGSNLNVNAKPEKLRPLGDTIDISIHPLKVKLCILAYVTIIKCQYFSLLAL